MITTTVGEVIDALRKYDRSTPVVVAHPNENGYNQIVVTRAMVYRIMVNSDESLQVDFVDSLSTNLPESFLAVVL